MRYIVSEIHKASAPSTQASIFNEVSHATKFIANANNNRRRLITDFNFY